MTILLAIVITAWHLFLLRPAWVHIRNRIAPRPVDFALGSFLIYYDVGLILGATGFSYEAPGFEALEFASTVTQVFVYGALVVVPPVILLAARWGRPKQVEWAGLERRRMSAHQERALLILFATVASVAMVVSVAALIRGGNIPGARLTISNWLGAAAFLLYLPIHFAAYFALSENARGRRGTVIALVMAASAALGVLALGQRTLVLLPFLIVAVCLFRFSFTRLLAAVAVAVAIVVGLGLAFKPSGVSGSDSPSIIATLNENFARAPVTAKSFELSRPVGTFVMAYPAEGYATVAMFAVPRGIAPFKGETTAQRFTDAVQGDSRGERWAFGVGMIEEAIINVGWVLGIFAVASIGYGLGAIESVIKRRAALLLPVAGGALWLCGYHLFAILLLWGLMFATILITDIWLFGHSSETWKRMQHWLHRQLAPLRGVFSRMRGAAS